MAKPSWWHRVKQSVHRGRAGGKRSLPRGRSIRLGAERLEDRTLLAAGMLDPAFGTGGKVMTDFTGSLDNVAQAVAVQPDGKLIAGGTVTTAAAGVSAALVRYNTNGSLDPTFGTGGRVTACETALPRCEFREVRDLRVLPDGKFLAVGSFTAPDGELRRSVVARYNADGSLDTRFGNGGLATAAFAGEANAVILQADGKIVIVGSNTVSVRPPSGRTFAVARYNLNGTLDTGFGSNGVVLTRIGPVNPNNQEEARDVAIQADGKLLVVGTEGGRRAAMVRYNLNGTLDAGFGSGGKVITNFGDVNDTSITATGVGIVARADGTLLLVGTRYRFIPSKFGNILTAVAHIPIGANGTFLGSATFPVGEGNREVFRLEVGPGGQVFLATSFSLIRLPEAGLSAASVGTTLTTFNGFLGLAVQPDGKAVLAGWTTGNSRSRDFRLARYTSGASLEADASFGSNGEVDTDFIGPVHSEIRAVAVQADGRIVVAGTAGADFGLARYRPDGSLDATFGAGGKVMTDFGHTDAPGAIAIQADGKIVVAGESPHNLVLARYNLDGSLDSAFGFRGKVIIGTNALFAVTALLLQPDGRIVVTGRATGSSEIRFFLRACPIS